MIYAVFLIVGYLVGVLINVLADFLPARRVAETTPPFFRFSSVDNSALVRHFLRPQQNPANQEPTRNRALAVELGTMVLLGLLPLTNVALPVLIVHALFLAILILVIVIDSEHRLILHIVTFPTTILAILLSIFIQDDTYYSWQSAIVGAIGGFLFFYFFYWVGRIMFGPGALGFGDVTLSMTMGAMLGFHRIFIALVLAILFGGLFNFALIAIRKRDIKSHVAYGPYLAYAGMIMIIWGTQIYEWYVG